VTAREEALVPGARIEDEVIRLDLIEAEAPPVWRRAFAGAPGTGRRRRMLVALSLALAATDLACLLVAIAFAGSVTAEPEGAGSVGGLVMTYAALGWIAVFTAYGLYRPLDLAAHDEFRRLLGATSLSSLILTVAILWIEPDVPRAWPLLAWLSVLGLELLGRGFWRKVQARLRRGPLSHRTVIVGMNGEARRVAQDLTADGSGHKLLGHLRIADGGDDGMLVLGTIADLKSVIRKVGADCLFVAGSDLERSATEDIARVARRERVRVCYGANVPPTLVWRFGLEQIKESVALTVSSAGLTTTRAGIKRAMDIAMAGIAILATAPILLATTLAIRLTSRGPALFRQTRVTQGGRTFTMLKFRTMRTDADSIIRQVDADETQPFFKLRVDPRLTAVGRFIRRLSIDELPQLINVLRGDMSIVGPRPLPAEQVASNLDMLGPRHEVRAGLTGWWQINGRADLTPEESIRMDLFYIENWSPSLDLYIMLKTFGAVLSLKGAY
jgi:exopolysaccharide biosynthesis polyprenyl glycosylphosphotransferase